MADDILFPTDNSYLSPRVIRFNEYRKRGFSDAEALAKMNEMDSGRSPVMGTQPVAPAPMPAPENNEQALFDSLYPINNFKKTEAPAIPEMPTLPVTGKEKESNELSRIDDLINSLKPSDKDREFNRRMALANMFFKIASSKEPTFFGAVGKGMSESIPDVTKAYSQYMPEVSLNQANLLSKLAADKLEREKMAANIDYQNRYLDVLKANKASTGEDKSANYYKNLAQLNYNQAKTIRAANRDVQGQVIDSAKELEAQRYEDMADQYSNAAASSLGFVAPAKQSDKGNIKGYIFNRGTGIIPNEQGE